MRLLGLCVLFLAANIVKANVTPTNPRPGDLVTVDAGPGQGRVRWQIVESPTRDLPELTPAVDGQRITFVPLIPGDYVLAWTRGGLTNQVGISVASIENAPAPNRPYLLGFTPFPYELTIPAVEQVYSYIGTDGDIISHHIEDGVPWPEALSGAAFDSHLTDDWTWRKAQTPVGHKVFVSISPLNDYRNSMALYHGTASNQPLPAPWDTYAFNHPNVKTAYLNYVRRTIQFFNPDYLAIGIEANILKKSASTTVWNQYVELHQETYTAIKAEYPDLPIMVTFVAAGFLSHSATLVDQLDNAQTLAAWNDLKNYTDYFALSLHAVALRPPEQNAAVTEIDFTDFDYTVFNAIFAQTTKPVAITETSCPGENTSLAGGTVAYITSEAAQDTFFQQLFSTLDNYDCEFVINFATRDYDAVVAAMTDPAAQELASTWQDTGLWDEDGTERQVLTTWRGALARTHVNPEIIVFGNGNEIADGDTTPSSTDNTDFGSAISGSEGDAVTFTIKNAGITDLVLSAAVTITGADRGDFEIVTPLTTSTLSAYTQTTVAIKFKPSDTGTRNATVEISSNDADEATYTFAISGEGTAPSRGGGGGGGCAIGESSSPGSFIILGVLAVALMWTMYVPMRRESMLPH